MFIWSLAFNFFSFFSAQHLVLPRCRDIPHFPSSSGDVQFSASSLASVAAWTIDRLELYYVESIGLPGIGKPVQ